jgi:hypothetical protein
MTIASRRSSVQTKGGSLVLAPGRKGFLFLGHDLTPALQLQDMQ